jgi:PRTRC genetic system ThiF family protein
LGGDWEAVPGHLKNRSRLTNDTDFVIGCVDSRAARATIQEVVTASWSTIRYWLDIGNNADTGQFVLGQPLNHLNSHKALRLRTIVDMYPDIANAALDDDLQPSCSTAESLNRQHAFINQTLANHALALLSRLFRFGRLQYHGGFVSLASGAAVPLRIDPKVWRAYRRGTNGRGPRALP